MLDNVSIMNSTKFKRKLLFSTIPYFLFSFILIAFNLENTNPIYIEFLSIFKACDVAHLYICRKIL